MASFIKSFLAGFRLVDGTDLNNLVLPLNNLQGNGTSASLTASALAIGTSTALANAGTLKIQPQIVSTAGASQGNATAITKALAIITVNTTASTHGVRLPTAATGLMVWIANAATTFSFKIYPATNGKIGAAATNATDTVLAKNKANLYIALNTTYWAVQRGS